MSEKPLVCSKESCNTCNGCYYTQDTLKFLNDSVETFTSRIELLKRWGKEQFVEEMEWNNIRPLKHAIKAVNEHEILEADVKRLNTECRNLRYELWQATLELTNTTLKLEESESELLDTKQLFMDEVEAYKAKEKICTSCEHHPHWQTRAERAEAEVVKLKEIIKNLKGGA